MVEHIFISHTKKDERFCSNFDKVNSRVGLAAFRSEIECLARPPWTTIKEKMEKSVAMFLLIGRELVTYQDEARLVEEIYRDWVHTQNWITYEVGLAHKIGLDIWVLCDNVEINFPVPYLNNYDIRGVDFDHREGMENYWWLRKRLEDYRDGKKYPLGWNPDYIFKCPHETCQISFNFHSYMEKNSYIICPSCLREIHLENGWLL